ncbi:MAG: YcgN family cysteine cluster protein [Anaerolineaceae bacterium]|nr:YcgN family cysteine cluster protein [Anaerolineaceae bacterium]
MEEVPFWKQKKLEEFTKKEWESICDGCGKCCLFQLEGDEGQYYTTNVICKLFDEATCQCTDYLNRQKLVPTCLVLDPELIKSLDWMPITCAYRLLGEGKDLPWWHHLVSGSRDTIHQIGVSVRGKIESENDVDLDDLEDHVVDWFNQSWMVD